MEIPTEILEAFGLTLTGYTVTALSGGNINGTFKLEGESTYVLQSINTHVFKNPEYIDTNLRLVKEHLKAHHPEYLFPAPIAVSGGETMMYDSTGTPWRLLPFVPNSESFNTAPSREYAESAARGFARFTKYLHGIPLDVCSETIPQFHDLTLREEQFGEALRTGDSARRETAKAEIDAYQSFAHIGEQYRALVSKGVLAKRIQHHDTKFNNILFEKGTSNALCVVDLDTVMPGYFLSDIGDLIQFGTSAFEDQTDMEKIVVNDELYTAIVRGYQSELEGELSPEEIKLIPFGGEYMTYMLGLRFLTDYLNGEVYFKTTYEGQNLDKARNRLKLLQELTRKSS